VYLAARMLAKVTLNKLAELFSSARKIMDWLATCSTLVARQGQPMSWVSQWGGAARVQVATVLTPACPCMQVTPLGLPVVQPYRRERGSQVSPLPWTRDNMDTGRCGDGVGSKARVPPSLQVKTVIQNVILVDCNDRLPVSSARQRSAFPPNFVHSLDSTHMLMTTMRLEVRLVLYGLLARPEADGSIVILCRTTYLSPPSTTATGAMPRM
jgi:DNA-directed RNA polymerase